MRIKESPKGSFYLKDEDGSYVPCQRKGNKTLFSIKDVPSLGYKAYHIEKVNSKNERIMELKAEEDRLENRWFGIQFDKFCGGIRSIYDKGMKKELLDTSECLGNELICKAHDGDLEGMRRKEGIPRLKFILIFLLKKHGKPIC